MFVIFMAIDISYTSEYNHSWGYELEYFEYNSDLEIQIIIKTSPAFDEVANVEFNFNNNITTINGERNGLCFCLLR